MRNPARSGFVWFFLFLAAILASTAVQPKLGHSASTVDDEQRERIREIDREIKRLEKEVKSLNKVYLRGIRYYASRDYARVVLDLSKIAKYDVKKEDGISAVIRLFSVKSLLKKDDCFIEPEKGLLKCISARRLGGDVLVRIDLGKRAKGKHFTLKDPPRVVVDFYANRKGSGKESKVVRRDNFDSSPGKVVVVIDPGHGGKDPGAIGRYGTKEKDVTLKIARRLKNLLGRDGRFKVYLTRNRDVFVSLDKRTAIANAAGADIFISIHTNASRRRRARGVSAYVLGKKATDREALELAMRENGEMIGGGKVSSILMDLINYGKGRESLRLAKSINDELYRAVKKRYGRTGNLGVKKAPFYVLFGSSMPSVLLEVCFITNPREEKLLRKNSFLQEVAESIYRGVVEYVEKTRTALYGEAGL